MVKQYVGARYVPKFASPVDWAPSTSYEALTIVTFNNASYTSKVPVPPTVGNPANNPQYWALTGNYNAQVEQYRQETETISAGLTKETKDRTSADTTITNNLNTEITNRKNADSNLQNQLTAEVAARKNADTDLQNQITTGITNKLKKVLLLLGDSWPAGDMHHSPIIANTLKNFYDEVDNYATGGATVEQLGNQATTAKQAGVSPTEIYIICGTNDVFHNHSLDRDALTSALTTINTLYPSIPKHFFPNNAKTNNAGYTNLYGPMCRIFNNNGYIVHKQTLAYLTSFNFDVYNGNDLLGVQHLSEDGEKWFANICHDIANGGSTEIGPCFYSLKELGPILFTPEGVALNTFTITMQMRPDGSGYITGNIKITNNTGAAFTAGIFNLSVNKTASFPFSFYTLKTIPVFSDSGTAVLFINENGLVNFSLTATPALQNGASAEGWFYAYLPDALAADGV